ncbi:MAG: hypothetical protein L3J12_07245, partial [Spirochaetales bacterium]|nr:hypothetical protein [Spirochaetales bacterium]
MTLKNKVIISYILIFIAVVFFSVFTLARSNSSLKSIKFIDQIVLPSLEGMDQMEVDIIQIQNWLTDTAFTGSLSGFTTAEGYFKEANRLLDEDIDRKKNAGRSDLEKNLKDIRILLAEYYELGKEMAYQYQENGTEAGNVWMEKIDPVAEDLMAMVAAQIKVNGSVFKTKFKDLATNQYDIIGALKIISLAIMVFIIVMGIYISVS